MDWGKIIGLAAPAIGKLLSGGAAGMEKSRQVEDNGNIARDRTALEAIQDHEHALEQRRQLELQQRELDEKTKDTGYKQALHAQYLQNWHPAQRPDQVPTMTGGFNTIPQSSKDLAAQFEQQATARALKGEQFDPLPPQATFTQTPVKQSSLWEKLSGAAGLGLTATAALKAAMQKANAGPMDEDGGL
jgi:hypothetical protein